MRKFLLVRRPSAPSSSRCRLRSRPRRPSGSRSSTSYAAATSGRRRTRRRSAPTHTVHLKRGSKIADPRQLPDGLRRDADRRRRSSRSAPRRWQHGHDAHARLLAKKGVYKLMAMNVQTSEEMGLETLGPDNDARSHHPRSLSEPTPLGSAHVRGSRQQQCGRVRARRSTGSRQYFGGPLDEERIERFSKVLPFERMHAAFEGGEIVGGAGAFPFELSVPGGVLPCGGVTVVGVYPTHRRRGVLRAMMDAQLRDIHEREEPIAALWASEETIYGRFGYGLAAWCGEIKLAACLERVRAAAGAARPDALRHARGSGDALPAGVGGLDARASRACSSARRRGGSSGGCGSRTRRRRTPSGFVVLELDGSVQAYAIYRSSITASRTARRRRGSRCRRRSALRRKRPPRSGASCSTSTGTRRSSARCCRSITRSSRCLRHPRRAALPNDRLALDAARRRRRRALRARRTRVTAASSSTCATRCARGTRDAGSSRAASRRERMPPPISPSMSSALGSAYLGAVSFAQLRDGLRLEELVGWGGAAGGRDLRVAAAALVPRDLLSYLAAGGEGTAARRRRCGRIDLRGAGGGTHR